LATINLEQKSSVSGLPADARLHAALFEPHRADSAGATISENHHANVATILARGSVAHSAGRLQIELGISLLAALVNLFFGLLVAWVLVRYKFWGKTYHGRAGGFAFALPTAVRHHAGDALCENGWIGRWFRAVRDKISYTWIGIFVALTFIGLPFVVRTVQPVFGRFGCRNRRSCRESRRKSLENVSSHHHTDAVSVVADRLCHSRLRARWGIRIGRFSFPATFHSKRKSFRCSS